MSRPSLIPSTRESLAPSILIFVVALAVRLAYLADVSDHPSFFAPVVDSYKYHVEAQFSATYGHLAPRALDQSPFYPLFLSVVYRMGGGILSARIAQALLGAATCALILCLGWRLFGRRIGIVSGFVAALYGPFVFYDGELLGAGWAAYCATALAMLAIYLDDLLRQDTRSALWEWAFFILTAATATIAVAVRPSFVPIAAIIAAWLLWRGRGRWRWFTWTGAAAGLIVAGYFLSGFASLAVSVTGEPRILSKYGALNIYMGNRPDSSALENTRPGIEWLRLKKRPERAGATTDAEKNAWFYREVVRFAAESPGAFLANLGRKTLMLVSSREIPNSVSMELAARYSVLLRLLVWRIGPWGFPFGLLLPLAVVGFVAERRRIPAVLPAMIAVYAATILAAHACARYRLPILPWLIPVAVAGATHLARLARDRRWRPLSGWLVACAAIAVAISLPPSFARERDVDYEAEMYRYRGLIEEREGHREAAMEWYERALVRRPDSPEILARKASLLTIAGEVAQGLEIAQGIIAETPDLSDAYGAAGYAYEKSGKTDEAIAAYRKCIALEPTDAYAMFHLGRLLAARGDVEEAQAILEDIQEVAPWLVSPAPRPDEAVRPVP